MERERSSKGNREGSRRRRRNKRRKNMIKPSFTLSNAGGESFDPI